MARTISSTTTDKPVAKLVMRRTRRVCIEATADGQYTLTAEQEDVTYLDSVILSTKPAPAITINHDAILANKSFSAVQTALVAMIDAEGQRLEEERIANDKAELAAHEAAVAERKALELAAKEAEEAQKAAETKAADAEPVVVEDAP